MNQDSKSNRTELSAAQQSKVDKAYAAYLSGWLGKSIFDAWFPFFAHIILEQETDQIDVVKIRDKFNERYSIRVPMEFIHQVLAIGNKNGMFSYNKQCVAVVDKVRLEKELEPADGDYKKQWEVLCCAFKDFCRGREIVFEEEEQIKNTILNCIEKYDTRVVLSVDSQESEDEDVDVKIEFAWNKFVASVSKSNLEMFDFICSLSYGSILKEAIFLTGENESAFRGLTVFLDSPIIFALLGICCLVKLCDSEH